MNRLVAPPVITGLQRAWLLEIGMDARMLGRYALAETAKSADTPIATQAQQAVVAPQSVSATAPAIEHTAQAPAATSDKKSPSPLASMRTALLAGKSLRKPAARPVSDAPVSGEAGFDSPIIDVSGALDMSALRAMISSCQGCALHEGRSHVVFGSGDIQRPRLLIVGEAPGDHDDRAGEPFQGPTGKLLHAMLGAVGVDPAGSVFYTNIVKCRPLGSRPALANEVQSCQPYLTRQIDLLQPAFVLALGRMAALALLGGDESLDALRGRVHQFHTENGRPISLVVTHHPTSLLLHARRKADVWSDLNLMRKALPGV